MDLQKERSTIEDLEDEEKAYIEYLNESEQLQNELESMGIRELRGLLGV